MPITIASRWRWAGAVAIAIVLAGLESIRLGLDGNWDLKNYHFYNPYAFLNGRLAWDVAPAMIQSYHNPLIELPFYWMVRQDFPPRLISFLMAVPTGIAWAFLLRIALALFPKDMPEYRRLWVGLAVAIGVLGAAGHGVIGSTLGEWPPAALLVAALSILVSSTVNGGPAMRALVLAGVLAGIAVGLKLTYGAFALALPIAVMSFGSLRERLRRAVVIGLSVAAGFALAYGFWAVILYREFGNPFFPYFNSIFKSPWWEPVSFFDSHYGPRDALQAIFFPFYFALQKNLVGELLFRDWRLPALYALGVACAVKFIVTRKRPQATTGVAAAWRLVAVFVLVAYLAWLKLFGIYRYVVPLEMLSGILIVGCALYLFEGWTWRRSGVVVIALIVIFTTRIGDWGRLKYGPRYFEVTAPELAPNALVILEVFDPMAYVIPLLRADARFVAPFNTLLNPDQQNLLAKRAAQAISAHPGPIYSMAPAQAAWIDKTLARYALARDKSQCRTVFSNMDSDSLRICPVRRER